MESGSQRVRKAVFLIIIPQKIRIKYLLIPRLKELKQIIYRKIDIFSISSNLLALHRRAMSETPESRSRLISDFIIIFLSWPLPSSHQATTEKRFLMSEIISSSTLLFVFRGSDGNRNIQKQKMRNKIFVKLKIKFPTFHLLLTEYTPSLTALRIAWRQNAIFPSRRIFQFRHGISPKTFRFHDIAALIRGFQLEII